ncbi:MAG: efflux RND transporter permease subunit, partial [Cyanobacteria bacterium P01_A01_bin.80]
QSIRTLGSAQSVDILRNYEVILPSGGSVPLSTLGKVDDSFGEVRKIARLNNKPVVAFEVLRSTGSVMVTVEEGVKAQVEKLKETLPQDVKMELIFTRATFVRNSYQSTMNELLIASVLAVVVILLFLRDWRATLITAVTLPLSIIPTFGVIFALGYTLNNMTLLGLGLAVGNLVDDAVVEIENMERHLGMGKEPKQAAFDSSAEMGLAVIATSATIVAVFLPVAFMGGIPGQFFQPFAMTVTAATVFSTAVARMVTPMMGAYLLKKKDIGGEGDRETRGQGDKEIRRNNPKSKIQNPKFSPYASTLRWALRHRITTLLLALAFFIGSLMLVPMIPKGLVDGADVGISGVTIELAPGSTLEDTKKVVTQATNLITQNPAVDSVLSTENVGSASLTVRLKPKEERGISQSEFEEKVRPQFDQIPGARISFQSTGAVGGGKDLTIVLQSENPQALKKAADDLEKDMRTVPGLVEASSTASLVKPEILIVPDPQRAADLGVTVQSIARTAVLATIGDGDANLAKYNLPDRQIPIRVQIDPEAREDITNIRNLQVPSQNGGLVPLLAVADIRFGSGAATINRFDRMRQVSVEANLQGISLGDGLAAVNQLEAMKNLPAEVTRRSAGDAEIMEEIFGRFGTALGLAVMMIYAILVILYNNFLHPVTIMVALPLSLGGTLLALMIAQKALGLYALIGIVLLLGIVTKNSILLVDYAIIGLEQGKKQRQAVLDAGVSRLRPILMTSLSTIAGTFPLALGLGAGAEVRQSMGVAVIGGFSTSTLLTLVVVPVLFTYIDNFQYWLINLVKYGFKKKSGRRVKS